MFKRITASITAFILAFSLSVPAPALALAPAALGVEPGSIGVSAIDATLKAELIGAMKAKLDNWSGEKSLTITISTSSSVNEEDLKKAVLEFLNENGQYFFLSRGSASQDYEEFEVGDNKTVSISIRQGSPVLVSVTIKCDNTTFKASDVETFNAAVDEVLGGVQSTWTDEQILLYLHDYIVTHCEYDMSAPRTMYTAYGTLVLGHSVCQGYCGLYDYLIDRVRTDERLARTGIDSQIVYSDAINHAWNPVTLDGEKYYVDCTWDDSTRTPAFCQHENFLRTHDGMIETHHQANLRIDASGNAVLDSNGNPIYDEVDAEDWEDSAGNNVFHEKYGASTYESAYWRDVETAIPQIGPKAAYVKRLGASREMTPTATVYVHDYSATPAVTGEGDAALVENLPAQWTSKTADGQNLNWYGNFTSLATDGDAFIMSTPTDVRFVKPDGSEAAATRALGASDRKAGRIYGLLYAKGQGDCAYYVCADPTAKPIAQGWVSSLPASTEIEAALRDFSTPDAQQFLEVTASEGSIEYSEGDYLPTFTVKYDGATLKEGVDYRIEILDANGNVVASPSEAGTYTVRLIGLGAYAGTFNAASTFTIAPANNLIEIEKTKVTKTIKRKKLKKAKKYALPDLTALFGDETMKVKWTVAKKDKRKVLALKGKKVRVKKKAPKGTYTMKLKVNATVAATSNYKAANLTKTVTVKVKVK